MREKEREKEKALKGGIIRASYENNDFLDALYWDDYIIALINTTDRYSLYLKNGGETILESRYKKADREKEYPLLRADENPEPLFRLLLKVMDSGDSAPLKRPDYKAIWHYRVDFSDPDRISYALEINEPGKEPLSPEPTPGGELEIEDVVFQAILKIVYGEAMINKAIYLVREDFNLDLPEFIDHVSVRNAKKKWYPDYISALNDTGELIDALIEQLKDYTPPDGSQEPELSTETLSQESELSNTTGSVGELMPEIFLRHQNFFRIIDISKSTTAFFDPRNQINSNGDIQLYEGNRINVAAEKSAPLNLVINAQIDKEFLDSAMISSGQSPLTDESYRIFNVILTLIWEQTEANLNDPLSAVVNIERSSPWNFNVRDVARLTYGSEKVTPQQLTRCCKVYETFINTSMDYDLKNVAKHWIEKRLKKQKNLDPKTYKELLQIYLEDFDNETIGRKSKFVNGELYYRKRVKDGVIKEAVFRIFDIPMLSKLAIMMGHIQTIPEKAFRKPKGIRAGNDSFFTLRDEALRRIYKGVSVMKSKAKFTSKKSGYRQYFTLKLSGSTGFFKKHNIKFTGKQPARDIRKLAEYVSKAINDNGSIPCVCMPYPLKPGKQITDLVFYYRDGEDGYFSDKGAENVEYLFSEKGRKNPKMKIYRELIDPENPRFLH